MKEKTRRIATIKALIAASVVAGHAEHAVISNELDVVCECERLRKPSRRLLLQILHSTRALDSTLRTFTDHHSVRGRAESLGGYLRALRNHSAPTLGNLTETERKSYQRIIVKRRNLYMHSAGAFPATDHEVQNLLGNMDSCLARVLAL